MKFSKMSQLFLVSSVGLLVATLLAACQIVTIDYIFVATAANNSTANGSIATYAVDSESGALRLGPAAVDAGGVQPVALAVTADYANLYVANQSSNSVVHFTIASNGVLTKKDSITLASQPTSLAVNAAGTFLYVVSGTTTATLSEYALSSGTIGAATATQQLKLTGTYAGDAMTPTGVAVTPSGNNVYVTAYDIAAYNPGGTTSSSNGQPGWLFGFAVGSNGTLATLSGSPYTAGVKPSALVSEPGGRFVYVTDYASNQMIGYTILSGGTLQTMLSGPFKTGNEPNGIVSDPRGLFLYVVNKQDSSVSAYSITLATGVPTGAVNSTGSSLNSTDSEPIALAVDPALGRFVYTANYLGNSISGFRLNPTSGTLEQTQSTPYPTSSKPTAVVLVPHGNHTLQAVQN